VKDFRKVKAWEKAHERVLSVYRLTQRFPKEEMYGLTSQLRRSSASIPAKIAEGCARSGDAELARFLQIAMGSASETEYHLLLARDLGHVGASAHDVVSRQVVEVKKMLASFLRRLRADR